MAEVITRLKVDSSGYDQKIKSAQRSLDQFGLKGTEVGQKLSGLSNAMSVNIGSLSKLSVGLGAAAAAMKVAGDAFKQNEVLMDEWGRTTESATAIYDGFLNALNTGDISGFLSRVDDIVGAAREAYDALDELGTFNAFNQINIERAKTSLTEALAGYRAGTSTQQDVINAANEMKAQLGTRQQLEQNAYDKKIAELAATRGVDAGMLKSAMSGSYGDYNMLKQLDMPTKQVWDSSIRDFVTKIDMDSATAEQKLGDMLRKLTDEELNNLQTLGLAAQRTATEIAGVDKQTARVFSQKKVERAVAGGSSKATSSETIGQLGILEDYAATIRGSMRLAETDYDLGELINKLEEVETKIKDLKEIAPLLGQELKSAFSIQAPKDLEKEIEKMNINLKEVGTSTKNTAYNTGEAWSLAASAVSNVGSALQSIEDPGAKVAGIIAQAIAQVAAGLGQMLASPQSTAQSWGWVALAASGAATMAATVASIKSVTSGYANGGMIMPNGSPYHGDNVVARLNAGEGVLTADGISNASRLLGRSGMGGMSLRTEVSGENLAIVLDNNSRRRGRASKIRV